MNEQESTIEPYTRYLRVAGEVDVDALRRQFRCDVRDMGEYNGVRILRWGLDGQGTSNALLGSLIQQEQLPAIFTCYRTLQDAKEGVDRGTSWQRRKWARAEESSEEKPDTTRCPACGNVLDFSLTYEGLGTRCRVCGHLSTVAERREAWATTFCHHPPTPLEHFAAAGSIAACAAESGYEL